MTTATDSKPCNRCGRDVPLDGYNRHPSNADRRVNTCRDCSRDINRRRYLLQVGYFEITNDLDDTPAERAWCVREVERLRALGDKAAIASAGKDGGGIVVMRKPWRWAR